MCCYLHTCGETTPYTCPYHAEVPGLMSWEVKSPDLKLTVPWRLARVTDSEWPSKTEFRKRAKWNFDQPTRLPESIGRQGEEELEMGACVILGLNTEWPKKMYILFTHQYLWNKLWQCLDADGGHFEHLHWIQNSRTSLISICINTVVTIIE